MTDMVNPYIAGAPVVETRMFFGREDVFDWVQNSLTGLYADHTLVIHGQRRVGKTSVLKQLGNRLPKKYIPVFFDLQGRTHTTLDRFLWWLAREIVRVLKQERDITFPVPEKETFSQDIEFFEHRFLPDLHTVLGENVLLLTFDEFDNLEESEIKEELSIPLIDYLRRLMGQEGLNFIFSIGSSGRKLENMQASYTEFFKTALYKKISFLSREQSAGLITRPVEGLVEYDQLAVDRIYDITSGHPYFTQLICHELFSKCQLIGNLSIEEKDVESVLEDVIERGTVNLKFVWDEASDIEKWGLASLAHLEGKSDTPALADFLRKQRLRFSESDLTSGLLHLRDKDILTKENRFVIYLLKLWLKKNRPIEQVREELTEVNPIANRYIEIGLEFQDSGQFEKAIENFRLALSVSPEHVQAQVNIALVHMAQKAYSQAVTEFEKTLLMDDEDVSARAGLCGAYLALGDTALAKGKVKEALASYQKVLAINGEHTEARGRMAEIQRQRAEKALADGHDEEGLMAFSEALKLTPEDPILAERYEQAKQEKRTKVLISLLGKAEKEQSSRNWDGALAILIQAIEIDPENEKVQQRLVFVRDEQRKAQLTVLLARADRATAACRWGLVIAGLEEYLSLEPRDEKVQARLKEAYLQFRDARVEEIRQVVAGLTRQENFREALAFLQEKIRTVPDETSKLQAEIENVNNAQALAKTYIEAQKAITKKNFDSAINLLKEIINQDENYRDSSRLLAEAIESRRKSRKWWQSKRLWGAVAGIMILAIGWIGFRPASRLWTTLIASPFPTPNPKITSIATEVQPPAVTATPTSVPLSWGRLNSGQFLPRDAITAIVIDPNDVGVMYIGTENAGIYKTIDGGVSWQPIHNGLRQAAIFSLIIDPRDSRILYTGTQLGGVYKTTDGGQTWKAINQGIDTQGWGWVAILLMDTQNSQHLYFTHGIAIFETVDGGLSWAKVKDEQGSCPSNFVGLVMDPTDGNLLYTADWGNTGGGHFCQGGIYKSMDGGRSWAITNFQSQPFEIQWNRLWLEPIIGQTLYISSADRLWVSNDKGGTWTESYSSNCNVMVFDKQDPFTAYCGTDLILKTTDGGKNWNILSVPEIGAWKALAISPQDQETLFIGAPGLSTSTDGGVTWDLLGSGLSGSRIDLTLSPQDSSILFAEDTSCNLYRSTNSGRDWDILTAEGCRLAIDAGGGLLYRAGGDALLRSTDGGQTWTEFPLQQSIQTVVAHPSIPGRVYALCEVVSPSCLYESLDYGQTWHQLAGFTKIYDGGMFISGDSGQIFYLVSGNNEFYASDDFGESWKQFDNGAFLANSKSTLLAIDPHDPNHIYIATQGMGVLSSTNGGQNWQDSSNGLESLFVNSIASDPNQPNTLYAGTDGGAYVTFNSGEFWNKINDGLLGATVVYSIVVDMDSNVYASTPYGIFKLESK